MNEHRKNSLIWSISDEEFLKILNNSTSFYEIGKKLGFAQKPGKNSRNKIRERAAILGITLPEVNTKKIPKTLPKQSIKRVTRETIYCSNCKSVINYKNKSGLCANCLREKNSIEKIKLWKETGDTGCQSHVTLKNVIRDYIFEKQNKKCAICSMDSFWNGKELHFILDHIDGDASNNWENNLRLICPNCDSQLPTFKSRNKNSARNSKRQKK